MSLGRNALHTRLTLSARAYPFFLAKSTRQVVSRPLLKSRTVSSREETLAKWEKFREVG
jgi:hypothetical protein